MSGKDEYYNKAKQEGYRARSAYKLKQLDEAAGLVSHDLRNPLQIISANLALIEESEHEDRLQSIAEATERMEEIVDQVLTVARTGGDIHETEIVELQSMARQVWDATSDGPGTLDVETTATVDADPRRLRQCFENLFRNSVEHGSTDSQSQAEDGVTVTVGDIDGGFYVEDDGPGFPEDALAAGQSVVDYYTEKGRYGLQIVENVTDAHGWELQITNGEDGGARFEILTD
ncbi:sensor histidine kinase [Halorubrum yunnanense]|uniref:histidine kinase n=1 Tax=Halorubrum yunnanense TaxID=1526162 RepID=A0ABD5YJ80_9EURY|nr:HAMP domain-containing sensor histidine kinase [Halorubrum yunnanense]